MKTDEKICELRKMMDRYGLDAYIVPSSDPHLSEYLPEDWKERAWISGFTGSAGTFAATKYHSGLWADGRYFIQAEKQLEGSQIKLFKIGNPGVPTCEQWLADSLKQGETVGFSGNLISVSAFKQMEKKFREKGILINSRHDLVAEIWRERPAPSSAGIFIHPLRFTGLAAREKIATVREEMKKAGVDQYLISSLDDIAWLFNIRGGDIPFVPVAAAYALVSMDEAILFIDPAKVDGDTAEFLRENGIELAEYHRVEGRLAALEDGQSVGFDPVRTSYRLYDAINPECGRKRLNEITAGLKAVKNERELENFKECQVNDGIAMVRFLMWLEKHLGEREISEYSAAEAVDRFRSLQENNIGPGFATIAGFKDHGAMMHYLPEKEGSYLLEGGGMLVLDSGGQYLNGTTDITRTIVINELSGEEMHDFTMALKSHIALATARFLYGATGSNLDILARKPLWDIGLDYKCGTGHGVGYCLSVHEGPQRFHQIVNNVRLEKGMILTIEPGIYREGKHGVRTENMYRVVEDERTEFGQFMRFETMTYCPIDKRGIDNGLLSRDEKYWLNDYHSLVYRELSPHLQEEERQWLAGATEPVL